MSPVMKNGDGVASYVWVVPGVHKPGISGLHGEKVRVRAGAPPEGGRANKEVADLLTSALGVKVEHTRGMKGRAKVFVAADIDVEDAARRLGAH